MKKSKNPGTFGKAHGASDDVLADASDTIENVAIEQEIDDQLHEQKPIGLIKRPPAPLVTDQQLMDYVPPEYELDPKTPLDSACLYVKERFLHGTKYILVYYQGDFYAWNGIKYYLVEADLLKAELYSFLDSGTYFRDGGHKPFNPNQNKVNQVLDALKSVVQLRSDVQAPSWLKDTNNPVASELLACNNGLLHLPTRFLHRHTPEFFNQFALPYDFKSYTPEPVEFHKFLDSILGDDIEAEELLQEMFGYIVSGATSFQKIFMIVGPKRAGKGVIGRLIGALIGAQNICSPSLRSFATNFPLQPLLGKSLALMSDARLDGQVDQKAIVEHMLRVSGEDDVNVARKNRTDWSGRLPTRFLLLTNEVPRLADPSGALAGRFTTLVLTTSFFGKEDIGLTGRLLPELPGILNWALDGWDALQEQGRFTVPASSREVMEELEYLSSPILKFIDDYCVFGDDLEVSIDDIYRSWQHSCQRDGQNYATTKATFGRDLRAAVPTLRKVKKNIEGLRPHYYVGIGLRQPKTLNTNIPRPPGPKKSGKPFWS